MNTGARGSTTPRPLTYRCQYIGLHCINFQYGQRKWNEGPPVESRCQNESRTSFLSRTHFLASAQMCVEASDRRSTLCSLLSIQKIQTLMTACWSWREPRRDSLSSAARQAFSKVNGRVSRKSLINGASRSEQQIRAADGPRSAQSRGEANSNQLELLTWNIQYVHRFKFQNILKTPASFFKGPLKAPSIKSEQSHCLFKVSV